MKTLKIFILIVISSTAALGLLAPGVQAESYTITGTFTNNNPIANPYLFLYNDVSITCSGGGCSPTTITQPGPWTLVNTTSGPIGVTYPIVKVVSKGTGNVMTDGCPISALPVVHSTSSGTYQSASIDAYFYDLAASKLSTPTKKAKRGQVLKVALTVTNVGEEEDLNPPAVNVEVYLLPKSSFQTSQTKRLLGVVTLRSANSDIMKTGEKLSKNASLKIPKNLAPGKYFLGMIADPAMAADMDCYRNVDFDPAFAADNNSLVARSAITITK